MPRRAKDPEFCREFAEKLGQAVIGKLSKKEAAATLGVSRQMLDVYLSGKAMPGSDVILKAMAMRTWNLPLTYRGREITASQLARPTASHMPTPAPEQIPLPLKDALDSLNEGDLRIRINKKEADRIELGLSIRFAG